MVQLTPEQHEEVAKGGEPVPVVDPQTGQAYVLITRATFDRMASALDRTDGVEDFQPLMDEVARRDGWDDEPDLYADLDPRIRQ